MRWLKRLSRQLHYKLLDCSWKGKIKLITNFFGSKLAFRQHLAKQAEQIGHEFLESISDARSVLSFRVEQTCSCITLKFEVSLVTAVPSAKFSYFLLKKQKKIYINS